MHIETDLQHLVLYMTYKSCWDVREGVAMDLDEILGIDNTDPSAILADKLVANDKRLLSELVAHRRDSGLSQRAVAERMGITESAVSKLESGSRDARLATLRRYAHAIGVEVKHTVSTFEKSNFNSFSGSSSVAVKSASRVTQPDNWRISLYGD